MGLTALGLNGFRAIVVFDSDFAGLLKYLLDDTRVGYMELSSVRKAVLETFTATHSDRHCTIHVVA